MNRIKIRGYIISTDTIYMIKNVLIDSLKVRMAGIPKIKAKNTEHLARLVLKTNLKDNKMLLAGSGHYKLMWISDLGVAFGGLEHVFDFKILKSILEYILKISSKDEKVFTCYSQKSGSDIPWKRADSLPWLIHCLGKYQAITKDTLLLKKYRPLLQKLVIDFESEYLDRDGIVKSTVTGDWMDTIKRPSSTWNNICVLNMLYLAGKMGLKTKFPPGAIEKKLLSQRFKKNFLVDYFGSKQVSVDSAVLALYFGLFSKTIRSTLADKLNHLKIFDPSPIRASIIDYPNSFKPLLTKLTAEGFHQTASWPHLGLMFLNGLKKINKKDDAKFKKINNLMFEYSNMLETVAAKGNILGTVLTSEYGFSMTAGQYLEYSNS